MGAEKGWVRVLATPVIPLPGVFVSRPHLSSTSSLSPAHTSLLPSDPGPASLCVPPTPSPSVSQDVLALIGPLIQPADSHLTLGFLLSLPKRWPHPCSHLLQASPIYPLLPLFFFFLFLFFVCFRAAPAAYGGSQARGQVGTVAASLHQSHSNARSKSHLQPTPHLTAMLDP